MRAAERLLLGSALASALVLGGCAPASAPPVTVPVAAAPAAPPKPLVPWDRAVLYFAIVDRWADGDPSNNRDVDLTAKGTFHGGDLKGLRAHLDEIADLGVTALWITPVVQNVPGFVTGAGFPDWAYHGYWPDDFTAIDPRFGTEAELKGLVEDAHRRGIRVLLDVVYNHAGYNSRYLTDVKTRNWFRSEDRGTCGQDDLTSCVSGLPDWKTEIPEVQDFVMLPQVELARRVGLDGFRLDTVKHVDHPFWKVHRERTRAVAPGFFLLGEVWGGDAQVLDPWFAGDEMDAGFDFGFQGSTLGFVQGRGRAVAYDRYLKSREKVRPGHLVSHFLSSHDVPGALFQLQGNKDLFRLAAVLQMTTAGIPMVYYGEEVGRPGGDWPDNRSPMPWGKQPIPPGKGLPRDESLRDFYKRLIGVRNELPELANGSHVSLIAEGDLLVFGRRDATNRRTIVVAVNRGATEAKASLALPEDWAGAGAVTDRLDGTTIPIVNGSLEILLAPRGARVLALASGPAR
jgi:alpha-amylase